MNRATEIALLARRLRLLAARPASDTEWDRLQAAVEEPGCALDALLVAAPSERDLHCASVVREIQMTQPIIDPPSNPDMSRRLAELSCFNATEAVATYFALHSEDAVRPHMLACGDGGEIVAIREAVDEVFGQELDTSEFSSEEQAEWDQFRREWLLSWLWPLDGEPSPLAEAAEAALETAYSEAS